MYLDATNAEHGMASTVSMTATQSLPRSPWRSVGVWMGILIAILMAVNAARAFADPMGFAAYMGLPLTDARDTGFVYVYGLRALFLGLFAAVLVARRDWTTFKFYALAALVMPIGDAILTANAGAPLATIGRHVAIAIYLVITAFMLHRWTSRNT
jgi:hypothetical protein